MPGLDVTGPTIKLPSTGTAGPGDVLEKQPAGAQPAGVAELGQRRRGRQPGGDPDRRIKRAGNHDRDVDLRGDAKQCRNPAQRSDFQHSDIGGASTHHGQRVVGFADAFIGCDRHVWHVRASAQLGEFGDGGTGLFEVLQRAVGGQRCRRLAASCTVQPPLASTRTTGTSSRTALTRSTSSANV